LLQNLLPRAEEEYKSVSGNMLCAMTSKKIKKLLMVVLWMQVIGEKPLEQQWNQHNPNIKNKIIK
jgi:hypothetical protein